MLSEKEAAFRFRKETGQDQAILAMLSARDGELALWINPKIKANRELLIEALFHIRDRAENELLELSPEEAT